MNRTNVYELALCQSWYFANRFDSISENERRSALLNVAYNWALAMGYEQLQIPDKISPGNFRRFFVDCITDLCFDNVQLDRMVA